MYPYIHIFGRDVGTYGVCLAVGFVLAFLLALHKGRQCGLMAEDLLIVGAFALGTALLGGTLLYVFVTYSIEEICAFIQRYDFTFLSSGIVFYGGLIGGLLGALGGIRIAKCEFAMIERAVVPFIPLGHAIGRIGCVMAGCCHGLPYDGPFALYYPHSVSGLSPQQGYFPVQPLESLINVGICALLLWYEKKVKNAAGLLPAYLALYSLTRFFLEMLRGDAIRGMWNQLSTSQIISTVLFGISIVALLIKKKSIAER